LPCQFKLMTLLSFKNIFAVFTGAPTITVETYGKPCCHSLVPLCCFKDPDTEIRVMTREGSMANVLWVQIGGSRYAFAYDHAAKTIVMKDGGTRGAVLASFDNRTTAREILSVFDPLRQR
jgi:hypothetical protein